MVYDEQVKYNSQDFCRNFMIYTTVPQHIPTKEELFQPILDAIAAIPAMKDAFDRNTVTISSQISFVYLLVVMIVGLVVGVVLLVAAINRRQKSKLQNLDDTAALMMAAVDKAEKTILDLAESSERKFNSFENTYSGKMDYVLDHITSIEKTLTNMAATKQETGDVDAMVKESENSLKKEYESKGEASIIKIFEDTKGKNDLVSKATNIAARNILKLIKMTKKQDDEVIVVPVVSKKEEKVAEPVVEKEVEKVETPSPKPEPVVVKVAAPKPEILKITTPPPQEEFPKEYSELLIGDKPACQFCGQTKSKNKTCRCPTNTDHNTENECKNCGECMGESLDRDDAVVEPKEMDVVKNEIHEKVEEDIGKLPQGFPRSDVGTVQENIEEVSNVEIPKPVETATEPIVVRPPMRSIEDYKKMNQIGTLSDEANWLGNYINHNPDDDEARAKMDVIRKILLGEQV